MRNKLIISVINLFFVLLLSSCSNPKEKNQLQNNSKSFLNLVEDEEQGYTKIEKPENVHFHDDNKIHKVVIKDILPTQRYLYLNVTENGKTFWLATLKTAVKKGGTYYYKGGLFKRNYKSMEYDKVFDSIFLVSGLIEAEHSVAKSKTNTEKAVKNEVIEKKSKTTNQKQEGKHIKIADLLKNKSGLQGKTVVIQGKCIKINPNIMGRNWIHIKDDSTTKELVVTSNDLVKEGDRVVMQGRVTLDKDFGAGYVYKILLEEGKVLTSDSN